MTAPDALPPGRAPGRLWLVPTPLDFGCTEPAPIDTVLPAATLRTAAGLQHWVAENAKSLRAFLNRVHQHTPLALPLQAMQISELPRQAHKQGDHAGAGGAFDARPLLQAALQGHDIGLVSEAGMPGVADPGASVVRAAHALGVPVAPLPGAVSLMLALAASGMNGQRFAFQGYLPASEPGRSERIRTLEQHLRQTQETQILIETPYRNQALLAALVGTLRADTHLAVCVGLTTVHQQVHCAPISRWRERPLPVLPKQPAVFLLGA